MIQIQSIDGNTFSFNSEVCNRVYKVVTHEDGFVVLENVNEKGDYLMYRTHFMEIMVNGSTFININQLVSALIGVISPNTSNLDISSLPVFNSADNAYAILGENKMFRYSANNLDGVPSPDSSTPGITKQT